MVQRFKNKSEAVEGCEMNGNSMRINCKRIVKDVNKL